MSLYRDFLLVLLSFPLSVFFGYGDALQDIMRLINTRTLQLEEHFEVMSGQYAILSHTWGRDEVTFRDAAGGLEAAVHKAGYYKIKKTCAQAVENGLSYAWVDTCCIDKSSSAELSEAINSMFRWYAESAECYVYLADVATPVKFEEEHPWHGRRISFCRSRWFTRGWTLQELLAPQGDEFNDSHWEFIGILKEKRVMSAVARTTGVHESALAHTEEMANFSVAQRMSWAAKRNTTRLEDRAYSLIGLFDVNVPLLYGEGSRAFRRLQEEIFRTSTDHSIFAWYETSYHEGRSSELLAPNLSFFSGCNSIINWAPSNAAPFAFTNIGLDGTFQCLRAPDDHHRTAPLSGEEDSLLAILQCRYEDDLEHVLALHIGLCGSAGEGPQAVYAVIRRGICRIVRVRADELCRMTSLQMTIVQNVKPPRLPSRPQLWLQFKATLHTELLRTFSTSGEWNNDTRVFTPSGAINDGVDMEVKAQIRLYHLGECFDVFLVVRIMTYDVIDSARMYLRRSSSDRATVTPPGNFLASFGLPRGCQWENEVRRFRDPGLPLHYCFGYQWYLGSYVFVLSVRDA